MQQHLRETAHELALEIARALIVSGYRIEPPHTQPGSQTLPSQDNQAELPAELAQLQSGHRLDLSAMLALWQGRNPDHWSRSPAAYQLLALQFLGAGEPLLAYDVSEEGLQHWPVDLRLRQYQGLALARSGATERAQDRLQTLYQDGHRDEETLGLLARTYKDLYFASKPPAAGQVQLRRAADLYAEAYTRHGGYWSGINAATLATLLGDREHAVTIAQAVRQQCQLLLDQLSEGADAYWLLATLGEASVILEEWTQAQQWYSRAAESGRLRLGDIVSTRHNARLLLAHAAGDHANVQEALHVPTVAVFSGHMVDHPARVVPRFPDHLGPGVGQAIRDRLTHHDCRIGYASAAAGADVLFLEALLELGGEVNVVLPYAQDEFLRDSAELVGDGSWIERTER
ncbi:MAG: TRAFs-binding domain-containing protein, partial [Chloroflexota bacterium]